MTASSTPRRLRPPHHAPSPGAVVIRDLETDELVVCSESEALTWIDSGLGERTAIAADEVFAHRRAAHVHRHRDLG